MLSLSLCLNPNKYSHLTQLADLGTALLPLLQIPFLFPLPSARNQMRQSESCQSNWTFLMGSRINVWSFFKIYFFNFLFKQYLLITFAPRAKAHRGSLCKFNTCNVFYGLQIRKKGKKRKRKRMLYSGLHTMMKYVAYLLNGLEIIECSGKVVCQLVNLHFALALKRKWWYYNIAGITKWNLHLSCLFQKLQSFSWFW